MRNLTSLVACMLLSLSLLYAQEKPAGAFNPADFAGTWVTEEKNGIKTAEDWIIESPVQLRGRSYRVKGTDTTMLEWVDLHKEGTNMLYTPTTANQNDGNPIPFTLESVQDRMYTFVNMQHDFPKRIVYAFQGNDQLHAWIDDGTDYQRIHFYYKRQQQ